MESGAGRPWVPDPPSGSPRPLKQEVFAVPAASAAVPWRTAPGRDAKGGRSARLETAERLIPRKNVAAISYSKKRRFSAPGRPPSAPGGEALTSYLLEISNGSPEGTPTISLNMAEHRVSM